MIIGDCIASPELIKDHAYYALPYEVELMGKQMTELKARQHELAGLITEAMEQSSETWHDNAPADALFGELKIVDQQEARFKIAQRKLHIVGYPEPDFRLVAIGSRALCSISGDEFQIDITGNLPIRMQADGDVEAGSIAAPIPRAILGAEPGTTVEADINGRHIQVALLGINQVAQREFYENY